MTSPQRSPAPEARSQGVWQAPPPGMLGHDAICEYIAARPGVPGLAQAVAREAGIGGVPALFWGVTNREVRARHAFWRELNDRRGRWAMSVAEIATLAMRDQSSVRYGITGAR